QFHEFRPADAVAGVRAHILPLRRRDGRVEVLTQVAGGEAGGVLDLGREGELGQGQGAALGVLGGNGAFVDERGGGGTGGVNRRRPPCRPGTDDDHVLWHVRSHLRH